MAYTPKKREEENEDWMATYADAITLLLCFFVILISIAEPSQARFEEVKKGMMSEFAGDLMSIEAPFSQMEAEFYQVMEQNDMEQFMGVGQTDKGIMLELSSGAFYKPGSAKFKPEAIPVLEGVVEAIVNFAFDYPEYKVEVEGHTDDDPIASAIFPSNWELSAGRATRVVRFFADKGVEGDRLKAMGMGDAYPKVPNRDEFGAAIPENQELNRRIVVRIERKVKEKPEAVSVSKEAML